LPCRHIMFLRRQQDGTRSTIPYNSVPARWLIAEEEDDNDEAEDTVPNFTVKDVEAPSTRVLNHNEKYRAGIAVCQKIAEVISDKGSRSFHKWISYLTKVESLARLDGAVPDLSETTMTLTVGEQVTNSPLVSEEVTKSSVVVANCDDIGESIANSVDAGTPGSKVIVPQVNGNGECASSSLGIGDIATNSVSDTTRTTRRRLDMASENTGAVKTPIILLNPASNPAGRPKEKKATKKAKARKELQETKTLSKQLTTVGDITLTTLREYVDQKKLSLASIDPVFSAIRPMFGGAIYKRPKARLKRRGEELQVETNIRYVIPEVLVDKSVAAAKNAVFREQTASKKTPTLGEIGVHILGVGVFSLQDVNTMKEWHTLSKRIKSTRDLIKWVQSKPENGVQQSILSTLPTLNMYSAFKSRIAETIVRFQDLTRFAGENWLCDGCIFVAALHAVKQAQPIGKNRGGVTEVLVVDSVFLGFELEVDRKRLIDTDKHILNKGDNGRIVFFPVNISVDVPHWCAAIVDFRSCSIWIYDPKQKLDYIDEVERIMKSYKDGYNCGVLIVKWFETYLKVAMNTKQQEELRALTPEQIPEKDIEECRYKMFETIWLDIFDN
ncbi:Ulp1 protease family C-terminal catalytic domain-containing protein, partial [Phytophthora infestans]